MGFTWVMKYLPEKFGDSLQSERADVATRRVAEIGKLLDPPEGILTCANTDFVNIVVKRAPAEEDEMPLTPPPQKRS